jgi:DNA (cytosine-5)-methyltransferase 1
VSRVNVGSLFSGVGGMDYGLAQAGFEHAFFCESDPWRREVLAARWPGVPIYDDVREVATGWGERSEPGITGGDTSGPDGRRRRSRPENSDDRLDLLCGGFPCQDVSVAGRRAGLAGERSGLFFEFARIIDAVRPRWVLVENVPGLLSSHGGRDFGVVLGTLADLGYGVAWRILDSRFFGVPQRRRRVFILGAVADGDPRAAAGRAGEVLAVGSRCNRHPATRGEAGPEAAGASPDGPPGSRYYVEDHVNGTLRANGSGDGPPRTDRQPLLIAHTLRSEGFDASEDGTGRGTPIIAAPLTKGSATGEGVNQPGRRQEDDVNIVAFHPTGGGAKGLSESEDIAPGTGTGTGGTVAVAYALRRDPGGTGQGHNTNYVEAEGVRRLTPRECERLQGFPADWTQLGDTPDSRRYSALGDAVTTTVAEWIGHQLMAQLKVPA